MDYEMLIALKAHIQADPDGRGYSGMTDAEVAISLNTDTKVRNITGFTGDFVYQQTDPTEFLGLTEAQKQLWMSFCGRTTINPHATANVETVVQLFGNPSTTRSNLLAARTETVSDGVFYGFGYVLEGYVTKALALP